VCVLEMMVTPSKLSVIRKTASFARARPTFLFIFLGKKGCLLLGLSSQVYLQQNKKKAEAESKNCHAKTMLSLEKPIV
jgi:hypothetical protein